MGPQWRHISKYLIKVIADQKDFISKVGPLREYNKFDDFGEKIWCFSSYVYFLKIFRHNYPAANLI